MKYCGPDLARDQKTALILAIMSTLVIHPADQSTDFLKQIYATIKNKTVITGGVTKYELHEIIITHERVLMFGHGCPNGLFSIGQFPDSGAYIIDESTVKYLDNKSNNVFIWCHANLFTLRFGLAGFYSGMFISEVGEAMYLSMCCIDWHQINESNEQFASITSKYIDQPLDVLYENVIHEYGKVAETNPIAKYNLNRLFLNKNAHHSVVSTL
uniref:hypothetical protein n=1 Tax=uncultured Draconibacterium sp. TaxID=1573823 RepID=UPI003216D626